MWKCEWPRSDQSSSDQVTKYPKDRYDCYHEGNRSGGGDASHRAVAGAFVAIPARTGAVESDANAARAPGGTRDESGTSAAAGRTSGRDERSALIGRADSG